MESEESKKVIELLLDEQEKNIQADVKKKTKQLENIKGIRSSLASFKDGSQKTIHDISSIMEEKEKRKKKSNSVQACTEVLSKKPHDGWGFLCAGYFLTFVIARREQRDVAIRSLFP